LLQHVAQEDTDDEDVKILGVFSNRKKAELAIERFKKMLGFKRFPKSFYVDRYRLNQVEWAEGFITMRKPPRRKVGSLSPPSKRR
jgi:hypothetical protein